MLEAYLVKEDSFKATFLGILKVEVGRSFITNLASIVKSDRQTGQQKSESVNVNPLNNKRKTSKVYEVATTGLELIFSYITECDEFSTRI